MKYSTIIHRSLSRGPQSDTCKIATTITESVVNLFDGFTRKANLPAFWFSEQRTKTFITHTIMMLSNGIALHEPPAVRKGARNRGRIENGKVDYWFEYGNRCYFLEVKQAWQEMNKEMPNITKTLNEHRKGWKQVAAIDKTTCYEWDVSQRVVLTIAPFWTNWKMKKSRGKWIVLHDHSHVVPDRLLAHIQGQINNSSDYVNLISLVKLSPDYQGEQDWQYWPEKRQNYHYLMMLWGWN